MKSSFTSEEAMAGMNALLQHFGYVVIARPIEHGKEKIGSVLSGITKDASNRVVPGKLHVLAETTHQDYKNQMDWLDWGPLDEDFYVGWLFYRCIAE